MKGADFVSVVTMRELLEAGVHFGHQTRRWNPKMRRYIFAERGGIYIIDLTKTLELLEQAHDFARNIAERRGTVLFVGTKKQAQDAVQEHGDRVGMPYVNHRWLGGLLTNWRTISERIAYLHDLRRLKTEGQLDLLPPKERIALEAELEKLDANLGGVAEMKRQPDAVFVVDLKKEQLAVREARRLGVPIIGLVDTNADPDEVDFVIPGNDDAIRAANLITKVIADGIETGKAKVATQEFTPPEATQPEAVEEADSDTAAAAEPQPAAKAAESEPAAKAAESGPAAQAAERVPAGQAGERVQVEQQ
jgi:small subunit ribosomal protein S2